MNQEIVITRKDRLGPRIWNGLCVLLGMASVGIFIWLSKGSFDDYYNLLFGVALIGYGVWNLALIYSGKPLIETSPEGIMLCGDQGRCYIPWSNIGEISAIYPDRPPRRLSAPKFPDRWIQFKFNDPNEIYYDNTAYRVADSFGREGYTLNLIKDLTISPFDLIDALKKRQESALGKTTDTAQE